MKKSLKSTIQCQTSFKTWPGSFPEFSLAYLTKHILVRPSHSLKLMGGGGLRGSIRTTEDSTFGGGRKLFFPTCKQPHLENYSLRISVADPDSGSGAFLTPGSGMGTKSESGSGMTNPDHISESSKNKVLC
jgi:hypothetical protein